MFHSLQANCHQCFFICLIISFLWLRNFLHLNIKWSTVCSSSHGHIRLSVSPSLYKYDLIFLCPVSIVVNSGNIGIFCVSLFLTDGKKAFVTAPFLVSIPCCSHIWSPWSFPLVTITSFGILSYTTGPSPTAASFASLFTNLFPSFHPAEMHNPLLMYQCNKFVSNKFYKTVPFNLMRTGPCIILIFE